MQSTVSVEGLHLKAIALSPSDACLGVGLLPHVLAATPEMTWTATPEEAAQRMTEGTEQHHRVELTLETPSGELVGFAVLVCEDDDNVGETLSIQWLYVLPEWRGVGGRMLLKESLRIARENGIGVMAYTKRLGLGRFELTYRRTRSP